MKRRVFVLLSLVLMVSLVLSACSSAPAPVPTQPVDSPTQVADQSTQAEPTEPANPQADTPTAGGPAKPAEPTKPAAPKSDRKGGWLDRVIFSAIAEVGPAVAQIDAGSIDMYAVTSEDAEVFEKVKADSNLKYSQSFGSSNQLLFNPETCQDPNKLNPFSSQKIREAMNWIVDRNYVAQEIMGGLAKPKFTALTTAFPDYSRYADILGVIESKYAYNPDKAKAAVEEEMPKLGAEKGSNGKWTYKGKPVTVIGLIRTEDTRKEIGNYFANQMETLGFTVERVEKVKKDASPIWQGEVKECKFHFYTAGWINTSIIRDEGYVIAQANTNKQHTYPVFGAYKPSKELAEAEDKLFTNNFSSMEERRSLFEKALNLSMTESWWGVWVSDNLSFSPYRSTISGSYDLASGFSGAQLFAYTVRLEGKEGGELKIAQSGINQNPWNPIAGSNWIDDATIMHMTMDWGVVYNPYTGLYMPKLVEKAELVAQEGLPITKSSDWIDLKFDKDIQVPGDAWVDWDAAKQRFITAAEKYPNGLTTKTKSTVYYRPDLWQTTWHDGSKMSPADFVMGMIMSFDMGKPESKVYDEALKSGVDTLLTHFKGIKIVSTDPLVIETYDDAYSMDAENSISSWYPSMYVPAASTNGSIAWHNLTPILMAEENGELALSNDKALAKKVEWAGLLTGPSLEIQSKFLDKAAQEKYIPYAPTLSQYITADEAATRYENLKKWYAQYKHYYIGTGPYFVESVYPVEGTITIKNYENYLFPADMWSDFGEPKLPTASVEGPTSVVAGEEASFDVYVNFGDQPYPASEIDQAAYLVYNTQGDVVAKGTAEMVEDGQYQIVLSPEITGKLDAGGCKLTLAVSSKVVSIPSFTTFEFIVTK